MKFLALPFLFISMFTALVWAESDARANPLWESGIETFDVGGGNSSVIAIRIDRHTITRLKFSVPVHRTVSPPWPELEIDRQLYDVYLRPRTKPAKRQLGTLIVETWSGPVSVVLLNARADEVPAREITINVRSDADRVLDKAIASVSTSIEDIEQKHVELAFNVDDLNAGLKVALENVHKLNGGMDTMDKLTKFAEEQLIRITGNGINHVRLTPRLPVPSTISVRVAHLSRSGSQAVLRVEVTNTGHMSATIGNIAVQAAHVGLDHARSVHVGDTRKHPQEQAIVTIAPGQSAPMAVVLDDAEALTSAASIGMAMQVQEGQQQSQPDQIWFIPELPEPHENEGKMTVSVQGIYGAIWLADGVRNTMREETGVTSLKGLGLRLTYGLTARLSFEAEVMGASSGDAKFESFTWDEPGGMTRTADLYRSAALGRVQGGLMMRFGDDVFRPLVRLGLGLQGAGQSAEIAGADGVRMEGPEVPSSFDVIAAIGSGLDIALGQHFVLGFSLDTVFSAKSLAGGGTSGAFEMGIHLGYGWRP